MREKHNKELQVLDNGVNLRTKRSKFHPDVIQLSSGASLMLPRPSDMCLLLDSQVSNYMQLSPISAPPLIIFCQSTLFLFFPNPFYCLTFAFY